MNQSSTYKHPAEHGPDSWSRRQFLARSGAGLGSAALLLAGCGAKGASNAAVGGAPKRGGTLTYGCQGGTDSDTLDGQNTLQPTDWARAYALYDGLTRINPQGELELWMADSITPNADATEWTIRIPADITTHHGKPFTSRDVLFSLHRMISRKTTAWYALGPIDFARSRAVDKRTCVVRYHRPFSILKEGLSLVYNPMVPEGFNPKHPDGTGPFMYQEFTPGVSSTFVRNPNYWRSGKPYLDKLVITNINDETSQVNALESGQVTLINSLSASSAAALQTSGQHVYISNRTGNAGLFTMRVDTPPFTDNRVREAFRLIADRPAMLRELFGGHGTLGNDVFGIVDPLYDHALPQRSQDIPKAKALLAAAGHPNLQVTLTTTANGPAQVQAAQLFATQAKSAGVTINVVNQPTTEYFAKSYLHASFSQDFFETLPYLVAVSLGLLPSGPYDTTHQNDPRYNHLFNEALATVSKARQREIAHEMQLIEYNRGGLIIPYFYPGIDAGSPSLHGVKASAAGTGSGALYWSDMWLD